MVKLIDDEIVSERRMANYYKDNNLNKEAREHERRAEWLEELKCYKNDNDFSEYADRLHKIAFHSGYNKAIDDFAEKISLEISESIIWGMLVDSRKYNGFNDTPDKIVDYVVETSKEIAEQLKAGGENG